VGAIVARRQVDVTQAETDAFQLAFASPHRELSICCRESGDSELEHLLQAWKYQEHVQELTQDQADHALSKRPGLRLLLSHSDSLQQLNCHRVLSGVLNPAVMCF